MSRIADRYLGWIEFDELVDHPALLTSLIQRAHQYRVSSEDIAWYLQNFGILSKDILFVDVTLRDPVHDEWLRWVLKSLAAHSVEDDGEQFFPNGYLRVLDRNGDEGFVEIEISGGVAKVRRRAPFELL